MIPDLTQYRWRTGRKVGRTIYALAGDYASDVDTLIGLMDSPLLAEEAVLCHNLRLTQHAEPPPPEPFN